MADKFTVHFSIVHPHTAEMYEADLEALRKRIGMMAVGLEGTGVSLGDLWIRDEAGDQVDRVEYWCEGCGEPIWGSDPDDSYEHDSEGDCVLHTRCMVDEARTCRVCGCTDEDCSGCIERTGEQCSWIEADLCSACAPQ